MKEVPEEPLQRDPRGRGAQTKRDARGEGPRRHGAHDGRPRGGPPGTGHRQLRVFLRLSSLPAVTSTSALHEVRPGGQTPGSSSRTARCCGAISLTRGVSGVADFVPLTLVVTVNPETLMGFLPSFTSTTWSR